MAKKQFKAESKKLLDMMINSIYTHKEIFLRELISNASDAIDKLYYKSLTDGETGVNRDDFKVFIETDRDNGILKISDNGIGMTREELENNLGTIAKSGSLDFKSEIENKDEIDIIGQFGVGFYSAFMVSDKVTVVSRAYGSDETYKWESTGADGYSISQVDNMTEMPNGTVITLQLKEDTDDEKYRDYLNQYTIKNLVRKYSDYVRYPITMMMEKSRPKEDADGEFETYSELETLNSMVPLWKKNKSEITDEEYNQFYKEKYFDFVDPLKVMHSSVEGVVSYTSLMFIPGNAPYNYYTRDYEKGLQLYSSGVLIMEKCADLLPDCFSFVKGLVDSQDLSLNISRETLQHDRQLKAIAKRLEKKIKSELESMLKNDREKYLEFYKNFGLQLKYGVYDNYGQNKELLQDLIMFHSSTEDALVTLAEYVERMKEDQKYIYYASGETIAKIDKLPQTELLKDKGYEILYLTDDVDEFALNIIMSYKDKEFKSVAADDLEIEESSEEKAKAEQQAEEAKPMLDAMKEALGDKVSDVKLSQRLKSHPVCITARGGLSIEMEKVINAIPNDDKVKAERVLEINADHPVMEALSKKYESNPEEIGEYAELLYNQALLIEGLTIDDPVEFSNAICRLMTK
ncbi:MAG: molecular chaperone HtpG [Clostridiales bacterium]|nr:molecular chaperone HtpG [Clostridiales bacterium]MDY4959455.1 molecular chaperone HtpG [Lentihominibacter sp.]